MYFSNSAYTYKFKVNTKPNQRHNLSNSNCVNNSKSDSVTTQTQFSNSSDLRYNNSEAAVMANNNCYNYHPYALFNINGTRDDRSYKYWFTGAGMSVQFICFQCDSKWEDYERFKKHCAVSTDTSMKPSGRNYSNKDSAYQQELRAVKELIINAKERRRAEEDHARMVNANVNAGIADQFNNNNANINAGVADQVNNNNMSTEEPAPDETESESSGEMSDIYANVTRSMIIAELEKRKRFPDQ